MGGGGVFFGRLYLRAGINRPEQFQMPWWKIKNMANSTTLSTKTFSVDHVKE